MLLTESRRSTEPRYPLSGDRPGSAETPWLIGADVTPAEAARLCDEGLLMRCVGDVLVCADAPLDLAQRAACVRRALHAEDTDPAAWVVGHAAGLWLHAGPVRDVPHSRSGAVPEVLERIVALGPRARRPNYRGTVDHRQCALTAADVASVHGVRVTTPPRTAADLVRLLPAGEALLALDRLQCATGLEPSAVRAILSRLRGARGVSSARDVVDCWAAQRAASESGATAMERGNPTVGGRGE